MADTIYLQDSGSTDALNAWLGISASKMSTGNLHLFQNNVTISDSTTLGGLTEATFSGYAAIALSGATWGAVTVTAHVASSVAVASQNFTHNSGGTANTIYGAYITDSTNAVLLAAWNFASGPYVMANNGDEIKTTPTITDQSLN